MTQPRTPQPQPHDLLARCTPEQSALVQLLSVIHAPLSKHVLLNIVKKTGLPAPPGRSYTGLVLAELLEELKNRDLVRHTGEGISCSPEVAHAATLQAIEQGRFETMVRTILAEVPMVSNWGSNFYRLSAHALRDVRIGVYRKDVRAALEAAERYLRQFPYEAQRCHPLDAVCFRPFDEAWFRTLPVILQGAALAAHLTFARETLTAADAPFRVLAELTARSDSPPFLLDMYCLELLSRDRADDAEAAAAERCSSNQISVLACCALQRGLYDRCVELFRAALAALRKETGKRKAYFDNGTGPFFILALLATQETKHLEEAAELCSFIVAKREWPDQEVYHVLQGVIAERQGGRSSKEFLEASLQRPAQSPLHALFRLMALYWCASDQRPAEVRKQVTLVQRLKDSGHSWLAREIEATAAADVAQTAPGKAPIPLYRALAPVESWQSAISALLRLNSDDAADTEGPQSRLIWHFEELRGFFQITPREQKQAPSGKWSAGRNVSLKRLVEDVESLDYLSAQDRLICGCIKKERGTGYYNRESYVLDQDQAVPLMISHPHVYLDAAASVRLELVHGEPELQLTTEGEFLHLQFFPPFQQDQKLYLQKETPTRIKVYQAKTEYKKIAAIIGAGLKVPTRAKDQALAAINSLASVLTVQSDIGIDSAQQVPGDATPHFHLLPYQAGLRLQILVHPFSDAGPYLRPGTGGETVLAEVQGKRLQCRRDLKLEEEQAALALSQLTALAESDENDGEWLVPATESALELLVQLQSLGDTVRVSWPQGARFKIKQMVTPGQCKLSVRQAKDYFELAGEVKINEGLALDLRQLVDLARNAHGRFVELGDGEFLALSSQLRRYLDDLAACTDPSGAAFRFHPLASSLFEDFAAAAGEFQADRYWRDQVQRLREAESFRPQLPATLQAELRGYQVEGFNWLNRLAYWGVGACLADDMGLGKTVQALAQILSMAPQGPSLVVAPTSVCLNWDTEAARFAPTLNRIVYGGSKRSELLQGLKPLDLVICSYGLLQQDAELLEAVPWQAIVLDEAQAIKNMATKRSQAAMKLQGKFKMVATGTPIENHLGELWNVFRFINPGLLGSLKQFNVRYASPIEKSEDKKARQRLKRLIHPFILRRTKNQVLEELPPRTEITIPVEMGMEEAALYEAIRKSALDNLAGIDKVEGKAELHLKILAEIMRLRRACCNPRLVLPDSAIPSAKLAAFAEIVDELRENRHKALVFSQFVGHLQIIRNYLDGAGIPYQYLDGSTPAPARKERVDAFQSGSGDLFLISLKAGGVGLNLTAADYVIHMDPWWNPAVEDQASDRAHRIGQQRPVTIYRLVAKGTIEEKIVGLHQQKRGLADSLLDESDLSGKVTVDELLALLRIGS